DFSRYSSWLTHTKAENRYCLGSAVILILSPCVFCGAFIFLPTIISEIIFDKPLLAGILYFALLLIALYFSPRSNPGGQRLILTSRTIRLIVTAFFVELTPVLLGVGAMQYAYVMVADPNNSPEAMGILAAPFIAFIILVAITIGPIAFLLTPYTLPLANLINRPFDVVFAKDKARS